MPLTKTKTEQDKRILTGQIASKSRNVHRLFVAWMESRMSFTTDDEGKQSVEEQLLEAARKILKKKLDKAIEELVNVCREWK